MKKWQIVLEDIEMKNHVSQEKIFSTKLEDQIKYNKHYREFLNYLGISPEDFVEEFDIEMDDYAR